ncbi:IS66 family transposase [Candidatus Woesearchaeota archaeon]|nr:IS66 family transposase [Candidatus Woesearchaeota archaeon]
MISEKEVQKLRDNIKELEEENTKLREEKEKINQEKEKLEKEFEEFKAKHTQTVAELRKALKIKANKTHESKPVGAKLGHQAYTRHIPARIDCIKEHKLSRCPECNTKLGATQEIRSRYVTDVKLISRVRNTRHDIHRKYCPTCEKIVEPDVPNVLPHARFGLNLMLLVMYLRLGLRLPGNKVCEFLLTMYNLTMSEGEIVHILKQLVIAFGPYYTHLEKMVKIARVKHTDSTSWRVNGKNYFAWVFIAMGVVLYKIRKRNNSKVPLSVFGKKQKGMTLVIDRHSALRALAEKAGFLLQLCWAHILDDSKGLAKNFGANGKYVHRKLKDIFAMAKSFEGKGMPEQVEALKAEIFSLTLRHYQHSTVRKFVNNLYYRDIESLFRFVTDPDVDATNNLSERKLRHLVIIRKISNGSRSQRGAHATAILLSVIQTLKFNKKNILQNLSNILKNPSGY